MAATKDIWAAASNGYEDLVRKFVAQGANVDGWKDEVAYVYILIYLPFDLPRSNIFICGSFYHTTFLDICTQDYLPAGHLDNVLRTLQNEHFYSCCYSHNCSARHIMTPPFHTRTYTCRQLIHSFLVPHTFGSSFVLFIRSTFLLYICYVSLYTCTGWPIGAHVRLATRSHRDCEALTGCRR